MRKLQKLVAKLYRVTHRNVCVTRELNLSGSLGPYVVRDLDTIVDSAFQASVIGRFHDISSTESFLLSLFR